MPYYNQLYISIHAPRVGGDETRRCNSGGKLFQSTPPVWGATQDLINFFQKIEISIHAPRVGGDICATQTRYF